MPHEPINPSLASASASFLRSLEGKNRSPQTLRAYAGDLRQFLAWLHETNVLIESPAEVTAEDVSDYLAELSRRGLSGVSRARKMAAIREWFRFLVTTDAIEASPVDGVETPKREQKARNYLRPDEYAKLLAAAGGNAKDFALIQLFLQTGVRVSELCALTVDDVDTKEGVLHVRAGKGMVAREIELEPKGVRAIKRYLEVRPASPYPNLFLSERDATPLSERGVRWLVDKYCKQAGITKNISCHSLRHTFATHKAEAGVSPFQLQRWLGHANLNTTQLYVHATRKNAKKVMAATSL